MRAARAALNEDGLVLVAVNGIDGRRTNWRVWMSRKEKRFNALFFDSMAIGAHVGLIHGRINELRLHGGEHTVQEQRALQPAAASRAPQAASRALLPSCSGRALLLGSSTVGACPEHGTEKG